MRFEREIGRLLLLLLIGLVLVMGSAAYWAMAGADTLLLRDDNPRQVEIAQSILRGSLYDREGALLAQSIPTSGGVPLRQYPAPAVYGTVGYYSFRYGTGGAEAFYDRYLNGSNQPHDLAQWFTENVLHEHRVGDDVRLTLDLSVQQAAGTALAQQRGAVIVLDATSGDILALVSRPTYDPNDLDGAWDRLTQAAEKPFFNRALQGNYQAGGVLQLSLMATAALSGVAVNEPLPEATSSVEANGLTLTCAVTPPTTTLTLTEAFAYGCPAPFAHLIDLLDASAVRNATRSFGLAVRPVIDDTSSTSSVVVETTPEPAPSTTLRDDLLGQGRMTVNPMGLARFLSAVLNEGNAPLLHLAQAVRSPETTLWRPFKRVASTTSILTSSAARQLRQWMLANSPLLGITDGTVGSHVALARSGTESQAWFSGFVTTPTRTVVVVVVIQNSDDVQAALTVAQQVMQAYRDTSSTP